MGSTIATEPLTEVNQSNTLTILNFQFNFFSNTIPKKYLWQRILLKVYNNLKSLLKF